MDARIIIAISVSIVIAVGLALGLGLFFGLRSSSSSDSTATATPTDTIPDDDSDSDMDPVTETPAFTPSPAPGYSGWGPAATLNASGNFVGISASIPGYDHKFVAFYGGGDQITGKIGTVDIEDGAITFGTTTAVIPAGAPSANRTTGIYAASSTRFFAGGDQTNMGYGNMNPANNMIVTVGNFDLNPNIPQNFNRKFFFPSMDGTKLMLTAQTSATQVSYRYVDDWSGTPSVSVAPSLSNDVQSGLRTFAAVRVGEDTDRILVFGTSGDRQFQVASGTPGTGLFTFGSLLQFTDPVNTIYNSLVALSSTRFLYSGSGGSTSGLHGFGTLTVSGTTVTEDIKEVQLNFPNAHSGQLVTIDSARALYTYQKGFSFGGPVAPCGARIITITDTTITASEEVTFPTDGSILNALPSATKVGLVYMQVVDDFNSIQISAYAV